jgi:hypothetical protein
LSTAQDIIQSALLNINAYSPGQPLDSTIASTCLGALNDLLDSLSNDQAFIFTQTENIVAWTPGTYKYSVGNPTGTAFTGYTISGQPTIVGVTSVVPITFGYTGVLAGQYLGGNLTDTASAIPSTSTLVSYNAGTTSAITFTGAPTGTTANLTGAWAGVTGYYLITFSDGETIPSLFTHSSIAVTFAKAITGTPTASGNQVNTTTVTMTGNATATTTTLDTITPTYPGNFSFSRPLRIRSGYTRVTGGVAQGLDYHFEVYQSLERYNEIGFKGVAGPWPYQAAWQPTFPYGTLWVYPNPAIAGEVHLFTDYILQQFGSLTQNVNLPQGYARALKKLLALELAPMFGKTPSPQLINQAREAKQMLEDLNQSPVTTLRYDSDLVYSRHTDASFIMDGGFR